ncbi:MAG TPA: histidine kinase [Acidimicrobiales bacterium]|nr:histidine kinase [Acidimicrobiales bacterium]
MSAASRRGVLRRLLLNRDGLVNAVMVLLCLVAGLAGNHALVKGLDGYPVALRIADLWLGALALVGIWWRKRWPVGFAVFAAAAGVLSTLGSCVVLVAVFTVAVHRRWPWAVGVAAGTVAATAVSMPLYPQHDETSTLVAVTLLTAALMGWGMFIRARRQLVLSLRERAERAEAEVTWKADLARQGERERMAREMHDVLAHRLSLLSVHAGALEFRPDAPPEEIARAAAVIRANAHEALEDLRSVIGVLRQQEGAVPERPQPTLTDLPALVEECRQAGTEVAFREGGLTGLPAATGRSVYRIAQEALTNARKHAPGSPVGVELTGNPHAGVTVTVSSRLPVAAASPGSGGVPELPPVPGSGTGLIGLRERTELAGGQLWYGPTATGDFLLRAWLPWVQPQTPPPAP